MLTYDGRTYLQKVVDLSDAKVAAENRMLASFGMGLG
jgi:hypothetical protein